MQQFLQSFNLQGYIKINLKTAIEAGLSINANLIEIASNVYQQGQI